KSALDFLRFAVDAPGMAAAIRRTCRREAIDLVYVNGPRVLPAVFASSRPVVFHVHSQVRRPAERRLLEWTIRTAPVFILAASAYVAEGYRQGFGPRSVRVIYNGVEDLQRGRRSFCGGPARVGILGRIAPEKGHADFIEAAKQLAANGSPAKFFVYGERLFGDAGFDGRMRAVARDAPVGFHGWKDDVASVLAELDILAVPSAPDEAATRVILEAFSAGVPVVAYRSGGIPEIVEDGRTGLLTAEPNAESLARSLRLLMDDPALMERLSAAGRREWQARFRVERFRTTVCDALESHAGAHPRRGHPAGFYKISR
ncbi:MAG TPA: glycosyltransferase family 4 protein, partial [Bryobacteraceae bacterium]|nr:glycosyltransferase family 4 protein [Bryobacteraceae bacterium]